MNRSDLRDYELHRLVVKHIERDAQTVLGKALKNINDRADHPYYREWLQIIHRGPQEVVRTLLEKSERSQVLRSASPFSGVLSEEERRSVLERLARSQ